MASHVKMSDWSLRSPQSVPEYARLLAQELANHSTRPLEPGEELLIHFEMDDGTLVLVAVGHKVKEQILQAVEEESEPVIGYT